MLVLGRAGSRPIFFRKKPVVLFCFSNAAATTLLAHSSRRAWAAVSDPSVASSELAEALLQLSSVGTIDDRKMLQSISKRVEAVSSNLSASDLSRVILACKRFRFSSDSSAALWRALCKQVEMTTEDMKAYDVGVILSSLAQEGQAPDSCIEKLLHHALENVPEFSPSAISHILDAMVKVKQPAPQLVAKLCQEARQKLKAFQPTDLALTLLAMSQLEYHDMPLCAHILEEVVNRGTSGFSPSAIASMLSAIAKLQIQDNFVIDLLCQEAIHKAEEFQEQDLSTIFAALSLLGTFNRPLLKRLRAESSKKCETFSPQAISNTLVCLATFNEKDMPLIDRLCQQATLKIEAFNPKQIASLLTAKGKLGKHDRDLVKVINAEIVKHANEFDPQSIGNSLYALVQLRAYTRPVMDALCDAAIFQSNLFSVRDISMLFSAILKSEEWKEQVITHLCHRAVNFDAFTPQETSTLLAAMRGLVNHQLLKKLYEHTLEHADQFDFRELARTEQALARLHHREPELENLVVKSARSLLYFCDELREDMTTLVES